MTFSGMTKSTDTPEGLLEGQTASKAAVPMRMEAPAAPLATLALRVKTPVSTPAEL